MTDEPANTSGMQGRFKPGQSGNPAGKPKGARHAALLALDAIGAEGAADVLRGVVEQARAGDLKAADILLRRLWPERKGRTVEIALPPLATPADLPAALAAITAAVAEGAITPDEGQAVAGVVELHRRSLETHELERRIAALENRKDEAR